MSSKNKGICHECWISPSSYQLCSFFFYHRSFFVFVDRVRRCEYKWVCERGTEEAVVKFIIFFFLFLFRRSIASSFVVDRRAVFLPSSSFFLVYLPEARREAARRHAILHSDGSISRRWRRVGARLVACTTADATHAVILLRWLVAGARNWVAICGKWIP